MSFVTSEIRIVEREKLGQQSATSTLKAIARAYPGKLVCTLSLVALENALLLAYPLFAGFAVDSIIRGDARSALFYAVIVLAFWVVGAARRAVDTRTFTRIYADLAVPVILNQRLQNQSTSTAAARVVLAREFVDFFEKHVPTMVTALVSIIGAVVDAAGDPSALDRRSQPGRIAAVPGLAATLCTTQPELASAAE